MEVSALQARIGEKSQGMEGRLRARVFDARIVFVVPTSEFLGRAGNVDVFRRFRGGEFGIETILHPRLDGGGVVDFTVSGIDRVHREHHRAKVSGLRGVSEDDESIASASSSSRVAATEGDERPVSDRRSF